MKYISTRGKAPVQDFEGVLLTGLASDGGLYVPENIPAFSSDDIAAMAGLSYEEVAFKVMRPFVGDCIPEADFKRIIDETYAVFRHDAVTPLVQLDDNEWVLELFHGPTLAFKDVALQLLGRLLDYMLEKRGHRVVILGATSGDTGSAAIEGCRSCRNVDIVILHPHQRVSEVQRRQMTTVIADNIHNLSVRGNFDDCQQMVKDSFGDQSFLPDGRSLVAVNSINWARIMAQIVYYFTSAVAVGAPHRPVAYSVPTGNFGDIFAGYIAKRMGLPIDQLVIATNRNDILHRFLAGNRYEKHPLVHTLSPSMDIMISSNFERMMFELYGRDADAIRELMERFKTEPVSLREDAFAQARELFTSEGVDDTRTCDTIREVFENTDYLLDPHTAIGVCAARETRRHADVPMICLATAHPAKFADAVRPAGQENDPVLPHHMRDLLQREERYTVVDNDIHAVQAYVTQHCA